MRRIPLIALSLLLTAQIAHAVSPFNPLAGSDQQPYCLMPVSLLQNIKPNINLVLDFSGSMQFPAYVDCSNWGGYDSSKVANCGTYSPLSSAYMYNTATNYYGNFKSTMYYKYNSSGYFEENSTCTNTEKKLSTGCVSGNLLNWISTTRTDVLRKILTGGRVKASTTDVIESEGARYVVTDTGLHCQFTVTATSTTARTLAVANQSGYTCAIGTGSGYSMDVKTTTPTTDLTGIVQLIYPSYDQRTVDLELSVFNTQVGVAYRTGKNKLVTDYVSAINSELAYNGTPTGEALREAEYYFQQSSSMTATGEANVIGKTIYLMDPYYEKPVTSDLIPAPCRKSYVLLISDGAWNGSVDPVKVANDMHIKDMRSDLSGNQHVSTYAVYAFGDLVDKGGRNAMITTALFGGYDDNDSDGWPYSFSSLPSNSLTETYPRTSCDPAHTWDAKCAEWDKAKTGLPSNFYEASEGSALQAAITKAIYDIQSKTASGTAASVMGDSNSSGAMLTQALYFPEKVDSTQTYKATWLGELQALWYYVDPLLKYINIREDTTSVDVLNLAQDKIVTFGYDGSNAIVGFQNDTKGDGGSSLSAKTFGGLDDVHTLWRAGSSLQSRAAGDRTIYVNDPVNGGLIKFSTVNLATLKPYLDLGTSPTDADATNVINYTLGYSVTGFRGRTIDASGNQWKLGDILNSTPRMITKSRSNSYNDAQSGYKDLSYDKFIKSTAYSQRNTVFVGANDGMLHAFKAGRTYPAKKPNVSVLLNADGSSPTGLGKELWGFIPKNALPYLKHLGNPSYGHLYYVNTTPLIVDASIMPPGTITSANYCSNSQVKGCTYDTDCAPSGATCISVSCSGSNCPKTHTSWRTVLLGSMGLGGATRNSSDTCSTSTDCVKTPISGIGYSSYFALDVTVQETPKLLWEFSNAGLGYSTAKPSVVRIKDANDTSKPGVLNGNWFAVLASGPTGPIDTGTLQMKSFSVQPLTIFVLDLKTGAVKWTFSNETGADFNTRTGLSATTHSQMTDMPSNAYAGTMSDATIDTDQWDLTRSGAYSDDALYLGYVRKDTNTASSSYNKFAKGGVLRLLTGNSPNPSEWKVSKVIDGIGPVSSSIVKLQDYVNKELWLFFGTGRYNYKTGTEIDQDYTNQQEAIYGIKEPCYSSSNSLSGSCTTSISPTNVTSNTSGTLVTLPGYGWYIPLTKADSDFDAKRIITNPVASSSGIVFFTAFKPYTDVCTPSGESSFWAISYRTGNKPPAGLMGQALLQLSTGAIMSIDIATSFTQSGNREATVDSEGNKFIGMPPGDQPPPISNSNHFPSKKIMHIQER